MGQEPMSKWLPGPLGGATSCPSPTLSVASGSCQYTLVADLAVIICTSSGHFLNCGGSWSSTNTINEHQTCWPQSSVAKYRKYWYPFLPMPCQRNMAPGGMSWDPWMGMFCPKKSWAFRRKLRNAYGCDWGRIKLITSPSGQFWKIGADISERHKHSYQPESPNCFYFWLLWDSKIFPFLFNYSTWSVL